jgi:type II secretory pathway component GspD/PulD (secretin)
MLVLRNHLRALVVLLLACLASPAPAAPIGEPRPKNDSPAEKVRKALDQVIDVKFENQSLEGAVNQLREAHKINFVLDRVAVSTMGIDPTMNGNPPVNLEQSNVKLRTVLRTLLGPLHLTYAIVGDTVVITTEEAAVARQLRQRVSLDLDKTHLAAALKQLARDTATNLLVDPRVTKEAETAITLQLDDVPLETAVRLMAEMAGLKPVRLGNVLLVTNKASAAELRAEPELVPPLKPGGGPEDVAVPPGVPAPGVKIVPLPGAAPPPPAAAPVPDKTEKGEKDAPADPPEKPKEKPGGDPKPEPKKP